MILCRVETGIRRLFAGREEIKGLLANWKEKVEVLHMIETHHGCSQGNRYPQRHTTVATSEEDAAKTSELC
jgi:hypothetical protein